MEPIPIKMKMADATQVEALMTGALGEFAWLSELFEGHVSNMVREIHLRLGQAGCVIIQVDNDEPAPLTLPAEDTSVFRSGGQKHQYGPHPRIATARPRPPT